MDELECIIEILRCNKTENVFKGNPKMRDQKMAVDFEIILSMRKLGDRIRVSV